MAALVAKLRFYPDSVRVLRVTGHDRGEMAQALMRWGTLKNYGSAGGLGQFGEYGTVGNVARIFRNSLNLTWGSSLKG